MVAHTTVQPVQRQTDTFMVFAHDSVAGIDERRLIDRVEVPRYSRPNSDGSRLSDEQRLSVAVHRAVEDEMDGVVFEVLREIDGEFIEVRYDSNPTVDVVWEPEQ